jgi:hypothetical protein
MHTDRSTFPTAKRLLKFIRAAYDSADSPLDHLRRFVKLAEEQVAGPWWKSYHEIGTRSAAHRRPISPLGEMVRTYLPHILGDTLKPIVEPAGVGSRGDANILQLRLQQWADDANYANEDEKAVISALLACSVQYISRREGGQAIATEEGTLDLGQPCVQAIPLDRMVIDPLVEDDWETGSAIGHWIEVDRQALIEAGIGNPEMLARIPNVWESQKETEAGSHRKRGDEDQYLDDKILVWEVCFRHRGRRFCCTLPPVDGVDGYIVEPYELVNEPEGSRYVVTMLNRLPFSAHPISPAQVLMDAHLAKAAVAAKLTQQIEELERKYIGEQGTQDTIMRLLKKGGDQFIIAKNANIKEFIRGGMVKELVDGLAVLDSLGREIGPNIEMAGGRDDPSKSATMGAALISNASVVMGYWRKQIDDSRVKVLRRVAAMLLQGNDTRELAFPTSAGPVPIVWDAATFDLSYDQFKYRIRPTSAAAGMNPQMKLRGLVEILSQIPPILQFLSGMLGADPNKVLRVISDMSGYSELDEMLPSAESAQLQRAIFAMLAQNGQAMPTGMGNGPMGGMAGSGAMPGMGGMGRPQLPAAGPQTGVGQMNQDLRGGVPAVM